MTVGHLNARLHIDVLRRDKAAWMAAARAEEIDLSQWARRILKRAPQRSAPVSVPFEGPFDDSYHMLINRDAKKLYEDEARQQGISLAAWVRIELNAAASFQ